MHSRTKSTVLNEPKNLTKSSATHISNKPSKQNTATKQSANTRTSDRKIKRHEKQNIESVNVPSPQEKIKNKNFMPKIRKGSKLELSSTVSLVINESIASVKKQDLLDSLLYGQIDLTYSQELHQKEQQNEQLLILGCDQNVHFKHCKNLSPIKSISEYSLTENENQKLVIQKVESSTANSVLKIRNKITHHKFDSSQATKQIIFRRLVIYFSQNRQNLLKFYCAIHQAASNQDLYLKIRQYLFQNGIIFKKAELNGFVDLFCHLLDEVNRDKKKSQFSEQNFQIVMESIFFRVNSENTELFRNIWVIEQAHDKIFQQQDLVSIWKLIVELIYQSPQQIQSSFRQSRFCLSMDSNRFLHQTDEKSKRQNISTILEWLGHFIITQSQLNAFNTQSSIQNSETKVEIKISPPL